MALSYQKATLYGNGMIDYVHIHNIVDTQEKNKQYIRVYLSPYLGWRYSIAC